MLLERGADSLPYDALGMSAIICAAESGCSWDTVKTLSRAVLSAGDITAGSPSGNGRTPSQSFSMRECQPAVKFLLSHNANPLTRTRSGVQ